MEAIPAWSGVARTYRLERFPPIYIDSSQPAPYAETGLETSYGPVTINNFPAGERALQTIIQIHRTHGSPTSVIAQSILDLADWHLMFEKTREAFPLYEIAYELMEGVEDFPVVDFFSQPKMIHYPAPVNPSAPEVPERTAEGLVTVQFDITPQGSPRRLVTLESVPEGMMDFRVRKSIRASRFRPAIIDGEPQATGEYTYTHRFVYYPQVAIVESTEDTAEP
jgi:TonB family protein